MIMKSIFHSVLDVLFPKICAGCQAVISNNEALLCSYCRFELPCTNFLNQPNNEAYKKFYGIVEVSKVASLLYFEKEGITQHILHQLKYKNQPQLGILLANMFENEIKGSQFFDSDCCLVPVPLHPKRFKERGYNQIQLFTDALAKNHDLVVDNFSLIRTVYKKTQTTKNLEQRTTHNKSVFALSGTTPLRNKIVLVDDVLTTGSTLIQCIKTLQQLPGLEIRVLTIAYAHH